MAPLGVGPSPCKCRRALGPENTCKCRIKSIRPCRRWLGTVAPNVLRFASCRSRSWRPSFGRREPTDRSSVVGGPRRMRAAAPRDPRLRASRPPKRAPAREARGAARSREAATRIRPRPRPRPRPAGRSSVATGRRRATRAIARMAPRREASRAPRRAPARAARPRGAARELGSRNNNDRMGSTSIIIIVCVVGVVVFAAVAFLIRKRFVATHQHHRASMPGLEKETQESA